MEGLLESKLIKKLMTSIVMTLCFLHSFLIDSANGQTGPCTSAMLSGFTPCMDFITGSTANGSTPSSNCCDALNEVMSSSVDCGCMLVTGTSTSLPLAYIKRNLALNLPTLCGSNDVALQCQANANPGPPPAADGKQFGPPTPSRSVLSPQASKARRGSAAVADSDDNDPTEDYPPEASPPVEAEAPSANSMLGLLPSASSSILMSSVSHTFWLLLLGFLA